MLHRTRGMPSGVVYLSDIPRKSRRARGLLRLRRLKLKENRDWQTLLLRCSPEPSQPLILLSVAHDCPLMTKKGESVFVRFLLGAYRFLSSRKSSSPTAMMAMIMPIPNPITYVSVIGAGVGVGAGVASGASSTFTAGSAEEP